MIPCFPLLQPVLQRITRTVTLTAITLFCILPLRAQVDSSFHIYLMFGQSNMEGAGTIEAQDRVTNARVLMMQDLTCANLNREYGKWYTAAPPLNRCWSGLGPGNSFGRMLGAQTPDSITIGLVNASVSGCNIFIYKKGCPDGLDEISKGIPFDCGYTWLLDLAKRAQEKGVIKGILFHQGETNTSDPNWKYTVQQIVSDLKADLGLGDIPFLAGELLYAKYNSCCSAHNTEIAKLPSLIPNAHVISAWELPGADIAHFTAASYRTLGERYARKMLQLVYGICDSTFLEPWYTAGENAAVQGDSINLETGTKLVLGPRPANALGYWNWSGDGIFGYKRELTINTSTPDSMQPVLKYTNECGAVSHLSYHIRVCDPTPAGVFFRINHDNWMNADTAVLYAGDSLIVRYSSDATIGSWHANGREYQGNAFADTLLADTPGISLQQATFTNLCGIESQARLTIVVKTPSYSHPEVQQLSLVIFPNPARHELSLSSPTLSKHPGTWHITLFNEAGQMMQQYVDQPLLGRLTLDAGKLPGGTYSVCIRRDNHLLTGRFLKITEPAP